MTKGKAGISWPVQEETSDPVAKFFEPGSKLVWHYNWNKNWDVLLPHTTPGLCINAEFVPMIFAPAYLGNEYKLQDGWQMVLGYNEPDHGDETVAVHTTPAAAAAGWVELAKLRKPEQKLVSPAVAADLSWLKQWFSLIPPETRPDYLAVHVYTTTFESFRDKVTAYYDVFGLPIIVTEFAMTSFDPNVPPPCSMQQVHDFMGQTTKWLLETHWIVRYAWFGAVRNGYNLHGVHEFNRLMDAEGNITPFTLQAGTIESPNLKTKKAAASTKAPGRAWSGDELIALFEIAAHGVKRTDYEDKLDGRTGLRCLKTWQNTIVPFIKKALKEKGDTNIKH